MIASNFIYLNAFILKYVCFLSFFITLPWCNNTRIRGQPSNLLGRSGKEERVGRERSKDSEVKKMKEEERIKKSGAVLINYDDD